MTTDAVIPATMRAVVLDGPAALEVVDEGEGVHLRLDLPPGAAAPAVPLLTGADLPPVRFVGADFEEPDGSPVVLGTDVLGQPAVLATRAAREEARARTFVASDRHRLEVNYHDYCRLMRRLDRRFGPVRKMRLEAGVRPSGSDTVAPTAVA